MRPVPQTIIAGPGGDSEGKSGNCYAACLASILELDLAEVPSFADQHGPPKGEWWYAARRWARSEHGVDLLYLDDPDPSVLPHYCDAGIGYAMASGPSPRGPWRHVVVVDRLGRMVHDPHPSGDGLLSIEGYDVICAPYEPTPDEQWADELAAALREAS